jgi:hypothetical protein
MFELLWPEDDHHRWSDLCLKRKCERDIIVLMGASDTGKTFFAAKYMLCNWWADPFKRLWILSTTESRGSELRNWGAAKRLFNRARERFPWLAGTVLESKYCITADTISDGRTGRLLTNGIIFVPCKNSAGDWVGLGPMVGIKPPDHGLLGHFADELQFMHPTLLSVYANWYGKNFEGILNGNPTDLDDTLCRAAKPAAGWETWTDTKKTQEWESEFYDALVIALDGRDSPNDDYPQHLPLRFPYLISRKKRDAVLKIHKTEEAPLYMSQCVGKPIPGMEKFRVIPHMLPERSGAYDAAIWEGSDLTDVVSLDAAYGGEGGDRCVLNHLRFGKDASNAEIIENKPSVILPVSVSSKDSPETQIAMFCRNYCESLKIPPRNFFFDGRSTLAITFAQVWSNQVNVVDFGGPATKRPVSLDEYIIDKGTEERRLKRCDEHYSRFVTELWFSTYYLMIGRQLRGLTKEIAMELRRRIWKKVSGDRIQVETKKDMKERLNESPDLADAFVTAVEGARRLGFVIKSVTEGGNNRNDSDMDPEWLDLELAKLNKFLKRHELKPNV